MEQHRYGTTLNDFGYDIGMDMDGHMLVLALTPIADGDVTVNHGFDDYWLAKLGADGGVLWQNGYGGSDIDTPQYAFQPASGATEPATAFGAAPTVCSGPGPTCTACRQRVD